MSTQPELGTRARLLVTPLPQSNRSDGTCASKDRSVGRIDQCWPLERLDSWLCPIFGPKRQEPCASVVMSAAGQPGQAHAGVPSLFRLQVKAGRKASRWSRFSGAAFSRRASGVSRSGDR